MLLLAQLVARLDAESGRRGASDDEFFRTISSVDAAVFDPPTRATGRRSAGASSTTWSSITTTMGGRAFTESVIEAVKANSCGKEPTAHTGNARGAFLDGQGRSRWAFAAPSSRAGQHQASG